MQRRRLVQVRPLRRVFGVVAAFAMVAQMATAAPAAASGSGDSTLVALGAAPFLGSTDITKATAPLAAIAPTPSGNGYWLATEDGGVYSFGDAPFAGSAAGVTTHRIIAIVPTPSGQGYWVAAADGGVFSFGDAAFHGSTGGFALNAPIVAMARTQTGNGYWLVARDGGVFAFGDATFRGSTGGLPLVRPVVAVAASHDGYWLVAADGGVFAFGVPFVGSLVGIPLNRPVVAAAATPSGSGLWMAGGDGGVFALGDAPALGSAIDAVVAGRQVVAFAARPQGDGYWIGQARREIELGALGPGVRAMQQRLFDLGYWGPVDGVFGALTVQQVYAFQKVNGLPRTGRLDADGLAALERSGRPRGRSASGYVAEIDKTRQVILLVRDGYVEWAFNTSTGNGARYGRGSIARTPEGHFAVYNQINGPRVSALGLLFRPKYFTGGYAIHGSPKIPPYPASHGCARVSNGAINFIWDNGVLPLGTPVWSYS